MLHIQYSEVIDSCLFSLIVFDIKTVMTEIQLTYVKFIEGNL